MKQGPIERKKMCKTDTAQAILVRSVSMYADPFAWLINPGCKTGFFGEDQS
jgi:hypothetical protein